MNSNDPYQTQPLTPITQTLARPMTLPTGAVIALSIVPSLLLVVGLIAWSLLRPQAPAPVALFATPTLGIPRAAPSAATLPHAAIAYDAPDGSEIGALEPGRAYEVVARSGLTWVRLNVARSNEPANLVWVRASEVPEIGAVANVTDLATPIATAEPQVVYIPAPAQAIETAADRVPEPTPAYLVPPATPAPRSVVLIEQPTAKPCTLRELGTTLRPCNGIVP